MDALNFDEVNAVPAAVVQVIPTNWVDVNGHMNVRHYLDLNARGISSMFVALGLGPDHRASCNCGMFAVEHRLRYLSEVLADETVSIHVLPVRRGRSSLSGRSIVLDVDRARVANTLDFSVVHVGLATRRSVPIPRSVCVEIDRLIAHAQAATAFWT